MKQIKSISALLFAGILSLFIGAAFGSPVAAMAAFGILMIGRLILNKSKFDTTGMLGEFLTILDSDTEEVKQAKKNMNEIGTKAVAEAVKQAKEGAIKDAEEKFKTLIEPVTKENEKLAGEVKVLKDEVEKKQKENDDAFTTLNRFRDAAKANEDKGVSFGEALDKALGQKETQEQLKAFAAGEIKKVRFELKAVGDMGLSNISGLSVANAQLMPGIVQFPNRQVHIRDVMQTGRMTASDFHFLKETSFDGSVGPWVENSGVKPQFDINYIESIAPSQFVAGFLKISRKALDDITALRSSIANRLLQKYLDAEDAQILRGTGANGQLLGLFNAANSQAYSGVRTIPVEILIDSISQLEELNHTGTGILMRPRDYNNIAMTASTGSTAGVYSLPGLGTVALVNGVLQLNGVPIYKTTAMPVGEALAGDWASGAQLLLRQDPIVEFFEQDVDNVQQNKITVRVEGRVALPVFYGDAFVRSNLVGGFAS